MWFTILNRTDASNNLYKKALKKLFEIKCKTEDDTLLLSYGYISWYTTIYNCMKYPNYIDIFKNLINAGVSKIIVIGTDKERISEYLDVVNGIETEAKNINKQIKVMVLIDKQKKSHRKIAIRYNEKKIKGAILGSSNFTGTGLFESNGGGYFQKNLDIYFGEKEDVKEIAKSNINKYYKKILDELSKNSIKIDIKKYSEDLIEVGTETKTEIMFREIIHEIEKRGNVNYNPIYTGKSFVGELDDEQKKVFIDAFFKSMDVEYLNEAIGYIVESLYYLYEDEKEKEKLYDNEKIKKIQEKLVGSICESIKIKDKNKIEYEKKVVYYIKLLVNSRIAIAKKEDVIKLIESRGFLAHLMRNLKKADELIEVVTGVKELKVSEKIEIKGLKGFNGELINNKTYTKEIQEIKESFDKMIEEYKKGEENKKDEENKKVR